LLLKAIQILPGLEVNYQLRPQNLSTFDVVILNEINPDTTPKQTHVLISPPTHPAILVDEKYSPDSIEWMHPTWKDLPKTIQITTAQKLSPSTQRQVVLQSKQGPLISVQGNQWLLSFALEDSNWPLHYSFPLFWSRFMEQMGISHPGVIINRIDESGTLQSVPGENGMNLLSKTAGEIGGSKSTLPEIQPPNFSTRYQHDKEISSRLTLPIELVLLMLISFFWYFQRR